MARSGIPDEIRRRVIEAVSRAVRLGHSEAVAILDDLHLESGIPDKELESLVSNLVSELDEAGYKVKWDDITALWIEF